MRQKTASVRLLLTAVPVLFILQTVNKTIVKEVRRWIKSEIRKAANGRAWTMTGRSAGKAKNRFGGIKE